jgi:Glutathione S-transferase, C-terminal domain
MTDALADFNDLLTFSMHPAGNIFTVADLCLWGAIKGAPRVTGDVLNGKYPEIERWYKDFMERQPISSQVYDMVKTFNSVNNLLLNSVNMSSLQHLKQLQFHSNLKEQSKVKSSRDSHLSQAATCTLDTLKLQY